ncbi:MAG TPA: response regulator [Polyangiaceae bacterium]|nr:response regulator [Polyangiaceae bacterium]
MDIPAQPLFEGLPFNQDTLRTLGPRMDWEPWVEIMERIQKRLGSAEAMERFGRLAATGPALHPFQRVGQLVSSPTALYRLNSQYGVPNQYRNISSTCEAHGKGRLCVTLELADGYRGSRAVFNASVGVLHALPTVLGLPPSLLHERESSDRHLRVVVEPPASRTVFAQLKQVGSRVRGLQSMLTLLGEQEIELGHSHSAIEQQIDARRRVDAALQSSEARWQALAENAPGIILLLTRDGRIVSASRPFRGVEPAALLGRPLSDMLAPEARPVLTRALEGVQSEPLPRDLELHVDDESGETTYYSCRLGKMPKAGDAELCAFLTDVTGRRRVERELKEREAELQRAQRLEALGRLAGGVAHDFNNLLTVICGGTDILLRERWLATEQREEIIQIQRAGERAVGLTRQLLAFSRQQVISPQVLDLKRSVEAARSMLERLIGEDIHLEFSHDPELLAAKLDRSQFEQVLLNLAVNARDAMPRGGTLGVRLTRCDLPAPLQVGGVSIPAGEYVELSVSDSGLGMAPEAARRIFEPFYTTKLHGNGNGGGTGLGLAIVRGIVTQSSGFIAVESELGHGSVFRLFFPRSSEPVETSSNTAPERAAGGKERILIVEDDPLVRTLVRRVLEDRGYRVTVCERGRDALEQAKHGEFDLLLTDVVMPEISGPELARLLTQIAPTLKVLFMSGYAEDEIVNRGVVNPGVTLLPKPFTAESLAHAVRKHLDHPIPANFTLKSG